MGQILRLRGAERHEPIYYVMTIGKIESVRNGWGLRESLYQDEAGFNSTYTRRSLARREGIHHGVA
jgi:hypothetical protein